mgnify:FL=1|tara:strand:+ start:179 stop:529 length:351 start_codon:yes stop_codon:yes gene_type:complete
MKSKNFLGFTLLEVIISLTFITVVSSSLYLMASYLISSTEVISKNYLAKLSYRSYLERLKIYDEIENYKNIKINSFSGELSFSIEKLKTPNKKIYLLTLIPNNSVKSKVQSYWRIK